MNYIISNHIESCYYKWMWYPLWYFSKNIFNIIKINCIIKYSITYKVGWSNSLVDISNGIRKYILCYFDYNSPIDIRQNWSRNVPLKGPNIQ